MIAQINLVSDRASTNYYDANMGATLPSGENATNNIGLSPLFYTKQGRTDNANPINVSERGNMEQLWSATSKDKRYAYMLNASSISIHPSESLVSFLGRSLRCLVSTNNG